MKEVEVKEAEVVTDKIEEEKPTEAKVSQIQQTLAGFVNQFHPIKRMIRSLGDKKFVNKCLENRLEMKHLSGSRQTNISTTVIQKYN